MKYRSKVGLWEKAYIFEVVRGVSITTFRLFFNALLHPLKALGICKKDPSFIVSIQYPDERRVYAERFRGRHRLTLNEKGEVRCKACFLCATACPSKCIHIEAAEDADPALEKFPKRYEINTLRCIYCGLCVEACPVDAIRMDCGLHPEVYPPDPAFFVEDKTLLVQRSKLLEREGAADVYNQHMQRMQEIERDPHKNPFAETWKVEK
ncbi:MAG: NuoI/complex I 23 kDa subunit family protein [Bdellovibrionota bacterium]|jgi:NADH-quinone oxidoreductase subunit I